MKSQNVIHQFLASLFSIFLLTVGYFLLAPTQLGGAVTYVIVDGNSMEPKFHRGDLILVRSESNYRVGDAVTYQNMEMGRYVFHRIINQNLGRFTLQGDNNSWLDSYQPDQSEIVGKLWIHIPKIGKLIEWVRLPLNMALSVGLLGGILMYDMVLKQSSPRKKVNNSPSTNRGWRQFIKVYVFGFSGLVFLIFCIFSFSQPLAHTAENIPYQQEGEFHYSATGTPGIYDSDVIHSGEPVFPKLTCFLNVGLTYNLLAGQIQQAGGIYQLYAQVTDAQSGWQRTIPMGEQISFTGSSYTAVSSLNLCEIVSLVGLVEQQTGLHPSNYNLEIIAHTEVVGDIAGKQVHDTFDPSMVFKFDKAHFYLANNVNDSQSNPLYTSKQGLIGNLDTQANTISLAGLNISVLAIRMIALLGLGFSIIGLAVIGLEIYNATREDPNKLIQLKYGGVIVDVHEHSLEPFSTVIEVATVDDLAKLAERHGTAILHMTRNSIHHYFVQSNGKTYSYAANTKEKGNPEVTPFDAGEITQPRVVDEKNLIPAQSTPIQSEFTVESQNKGINRVTKTYFDQNEATKLKNEREELEIQAILKEFSRQRQQVKQSSPTREMLWNIIQEAPAEPTYREDKKHIVENQPVMQNEAEYVIQTGEISFMMTQEPSIILLKGGQP